MALTSTLGSPGIEIREVDNSYRLDSSTATTVYIPGFTSQGPVDEVMSIGSISDFETIYGIPTNAAERYFYYTVKAVLDNSGSGVTVLCSRLPYGSGKGDTVTNAYTLLAYPAIPVIKTKHNPDKPIVDANGYYSFVTKNEISVVTSVVSTKDYSTVVDKVLTITGTKNNSITSLAVTIGEESLSFKNYKVISSKSSTGDNKDSAQDDTCVTTYEIVFGGDTVDSTKVTIPVVTNATGTLEPSTVLDTDVVIKATLAYTLLVKPEGSEFVDFDQFVTTPESTVNFERLFDIASTKLSTTGSIKAHI
jgi:hypothetical protein